MTSNMTDSPTPDDELVAAERLLAKIRSFVERELDDDERALFAHLLAPGVAEAEAPPEDVEGFDAPTGRRPLPERLARAVRQRELRIIVDPDSSS